MKHFSCTINNIQHIKKLNFEIDLSHNKLMCIVGKNGSGKTTLTRAIKNLYSTDTFNKTAPPLIFNDESYILYTIDNDSYEFRYNPKLREIDSKSIIPDNVKKLFHVELPIPHGDRFNHFPRLEKIDTELRKSIALKEYKEPNELIKFLSNIYNTCKFNNLKELSIRNNKYYFILKENNYYIREDYLSSGEYFVINLYKMIQRKCKLIVIDEIDISLDASAQVNLIKQLRDFCIKSEINIVFTTHSLAIMKTLKSVELHYLEHTSSEVTLINTSYNYVKSLLFGFIGWDKYILTEDIVLKEYLEYLISQDETPIFNKYNIIYIAGGANVISLMKRNVDEHFFSHPNNVISILDGDQNVENDSRFSYCRNNEKILFIPFLSIEKQIETHYNNKDRDGLPLVQINNEITNQNRKTKSLYKNLKNIMSNEEIFYFINGKNTRKVNEFRKNIIAFLKM
jgi:ABC-type dipeptide/oligopeptide/nickel transport system ATPase subunit